MRRLLIYAVLAVVGLPAGFVLLYRVVPPPATPLMVIRTFEGEGWSRDWVALETLPPYVGGAVIAAEDNRFCSHWGFDFEAIRDALDEADGGGRLRGASTLSMQTAKNLFLWPGRDWVRKGLEAYLTPFVEVLLPKRRIMEIYLNIAEWGPGVYGIEAAARHHFDKGAANLSRAEAARLAAILPAPHSRSPAGVSGQAERLLVRVRQLGPLLDCIAVKDGG
ncbi:MAG: monofunctional biosynthetic peptidoglycan transglycosylase [Rhodospirillaceae bacterium]|nr:monofunctional biosynthetic peptidoglycan transglycosylase [Rhodospirillaceae bacterium]MBT6119415.1 monofunctional biosynthetic peptidoglycan transglycosylase [Rhodospirillaceae bacterium]